MGIIYLKLHDYNKTFNNLIHNAIKLQLVQNSERYKFLVNLNICFNY